MPGPENSSSSATVAPAASMRLPSRKDADTATASTKPPVWAIDSSETTDPVPPSAKCAMHGSGGVCCRELKDDDDRELIDPDIVRDVVIGLSDGLTVPFALTAGLSSLGESRLVVLGGVAELIAGAISMGIGGFLAAQAERDHARFIRRMTQARIARSCAGEVEREVRGVLGPVGVDEKTSRIVASCLREVENASKSQRGDQTNDEETGEVSLKWEQDVGLTAFLMKFGENMEDVPNRRLYISAFTIGMGYLAGGLIPLLPYFFIPRAKVALLYSSILTGIILLIFGVVKARITGAAGKGIWGYVYGAVTTLMVGGVAAGAAYGIVAALETSD